MDFEIEETEETDDEFPEENKKKSNSILPIIIVIIISIIVGFGVFFISNALFGKKTTPQEEPKPTPLSLTEENVEILYDYVTYGIRGKRNGKFLKESRVTLESFNNEERFYYALQFAQAEDFESTNKTDENNLKIYNIPTSKIKNYMQRFFGANVTFSMTDTITYPFSFSIGGKNVGVMTPSSDGDGFDTVFTELQEDLGEDLIEPYYTELVSAQKNTDGSYELKEKAIYTDFKKEGDIYTVYIYKDFNHTELLETKPNQTEEMLKENPIKITNYKDKATTITYLFKLNGTVLYFDSSTQS